MITHAKTRNNLTLTFLNRHNGWHGSHALLFGPGHLKNFIQRNRLGIQTLFERVHTQFGIDYQPATRSSFQLAVILQNRPALVLTHGRCAKDGSVDGAVSLLYISQHLIASVHIMVQRSQGTAILAYVSLQHSLLGRVNKLEGQDSEEYPQHNAQQNSRRNTLQSVAPSRLHLLIGEGVRIKSIDVFLLHPAKTSNCRVAYLKPALLHTQTIN